MVLWPQVRAGYKQPVYHKNNRNVNNLSIVTSESVVHTSMVQISFGLGRVFSSHLMLQNTLMHACFHIKIQGLNEKNSNVL